MKTNLIKQLAYSTVAGGDVDTMAADFALDTLSKSQLRMYARYLKQALAAQTLTVVSSDTLPAGEMSALLKQFSKKRAQNIVDPTIGAGVVIVNNDDIIDLSVSGEIRRFIRTLS